VSTRGQILNLLDDLRHDLGLADLFIGHDLGVVRHISDRIAVLYRGEIVEVGPAEQVADDPQHPYTQRLVAAVPVADPDAQAARRAQRRSIAAAMATLGDASKPAHRRNGRAPLRTVPTTIVATNQAAGVLAAERILDRLAATDASREFLLACPAGRSPLSTYRALGRFAGERGQDLSRVVIAMIDEYVIETDDGYELCDPSAHYSCRRHVFEDLLRLVNTNVTPRHRVRAERVLVPDPRDPDEFDARIADAGGVDLFLLASGASDGHVAFNPPSTPLDSRTRVVALADSTRRDNLATFPEFASLDEVPSLGVTVGLKTITEAHEAVLLLLGPDKAAAYERLLRCDAFDPEWPASVVYACRAASVIVDQAASGPARAAGN
jgi:glucosamine-6-phosphate deaminase